MSLVVVHRSPDAYGGGWIVVSDQLVTFDVHNNHAPVRQALEHMHLKVIITEGRESFVAFAGNLPDQGVADLLRSLYEIGLGPLALRQRAEDLSGRCGLDFIVGGWADPTTYRYRQGVEEAIAPDTLSCIGDEVAVESVFVDAYNDAAGSIQQRMETAMRAVIEAREHDTVGGQVLVVHGSDTLSYDAISQVDFGHVVPRSLGQGGMQMDSVANGAHIAVGLATTDGYPAIGYWYPRLDLGLLIRPIDSDTVDRIENVDSEEAMVQRAREQFGLDLRKGSTRIRATT